MAPFGLTRSQTQNTVASMEGRPYCLCAEYRNRRLGLIPQDTQHTVHARDITTVYQHHTVLPARLELASGALRMAAGTLAPVIHRSPQSRASVQDALASRHVFERFIPRERPVSCVSPVQEVMGRHQDSPAPFLPQRQMGTVAVQFAVPAP
jgi:hypothetical protein